MQPPLRGHAPAWRLHSQQKSFLAGDRISSFSNIASKQAAPSATHAILEEVAALPRLLPFKLIGGQQVINAFYRPTAEKTL